MPKHTIINTDACHYVRCGWMLTYRLRPTSVSANISREWKHASS